MGWGRRPGAQGEGWAGRSPGTHREGPLSRPSPGTAVSLHPRPHSSVSKPVVRGGVGWHAGQPAWPLGRALPLTTSANCKGARSGRALKVLFSCQSKRQLCLPLYTWGSPRGDLHTTRPRGRGSHSVLPTLEIGKQPSLGSLGPWLLSPPWAQPDSTPQSSSMTLPLTPSPRA